MAKLPKFTLTKNEKKDQWDLIADKSDKVPLALQDDITWNGEALPPVQSCARRVVIAKSSRLVTLGVICAIFLAGVAGAQGQQSIVDRADAFFNKGDCAAALPLLHEAVERRPDDYVSTSRLAICLLQLGRNEEALTWAERAARFLQERPNRLFDLAIIHTRLGNRDRAFEYLGQAVDALGASYRAAAENLRRDANFAPLRDDPRFEALLARAYGPGYEPSDQRGFAPTKVRRGVELLLSTIFTNSPNPYRYFTPAQWRARADEIIARADRIDQAAYFFELVSLAGMNGDVHTSLFPARGVEFLHISLPLRFWRFSDGLFIRAATEEHRELVGARVIRIGDFDVERGWADLLRRFPSENPGMSSAMLCHYLLFPQFARAQGWSDEADAISLTLRLANGRNVAVRVRADQAGGYFAPLETARWLNRQAGWVDAAPWGERAPIWMTNRERKYWYQPLPERSAIYFAFNEPRDDENVVYEDFVLELVRAMRTNGAHRLIIDLRNNPGGWGYMAGALVHAILGDPELNQPGRIVVLTSRSTQSAGVIIAAALERQTNAVFVGEPTGDAPNSFNAPVGNHVSWAIPGAPIVFRFSRLWEQESDALDTRNAIYPDVPVSMSFADYTAGRDPVLERALSMTDAEASAFLRDPGGRLLPWYARWRRDSQAPAFPNGELPRRYY